MTAINQPAPLMDSAPVAEWLGISPNALAKMRVEGTGPAFIRVGSRIKYAISDVEDYINTNRRTSTVA